MPGAPNISVQIHELMTILENLPAEKLTPEVREKVLKYVKDLPPATRPPDLYRVLCNRLRMSELQLQAELEPDSKRREPFENLVPPKGWLSEYIEYTRNTEPPTVFHFFSGAVAIGTALARNIHFPFGDGSIFPNLCVVVVAPSGVCRKTTACNMAIGLYRLIGGNVLADKITPEALIEAMQGKDSATGLIYAPELAVFLGKQKYQEGMIPMLTAWFDCPQRWQASTIMRGEAELHNVAMSMLGASTLDWIQTAIPKDAFGGGFMSRLLFVVQESTDRVFPIPPPVNEQMKAKLGEALRKFGHIRGKVEMSPEALHWYNDWYRGRDGRNTENRHYAGYFERKPTQMIRLAMILGISEFGNTWDLIVTADHMKRALAILNWVEGFLPGAFDQLHETSVGSDQMQIIVQLRKRQGAVKHSELLRLNARRMNADIFRKCMDTLRQSGLVEWDNNAKQYYLTPEGWRA